MKLRPYQKIVLDRLYQLPNTLPQTIQFSQPLHPRSWTSMYYQKEKLMKEGPYKSSTHGNIPLSLRGRELLDELRKSVTGAIAGDDFNANGQALSCARGEIAKYMSELEAYADRFHSRAPSDVRYSMGEPPQVVKRPKPLAGYRLDGAILDDLCDAKRHSSLADALLYTFANPIKISPKFPTVQETPMKYPEVLGSNIYAAADQQATATPVEKTRSDLISDATRELVIAQRGLERLQSEAGQEVGPLSLSSDLLGYCQTTSAVAELVKEQWTALAKKAVARAKARVAKAEKAVAALLS